MPRLPSSRLPASPSPKACSLPLERGVSRAGRPTQPSRSAALILTTATILFLAACGGGGSPAGPDAASAEGQGAGSGASAAVAGGGQVAANGSGSPAGSNDSSGNTSGLGSGTADLTGNADDEGTAGSAGSEGGEGGEGGGSSSGSDGASGASTPDRGSQGSNSGSSANPGGNGGGNPGSNAGANPGSPDPIGAVRTGEGTYHPGTDGSGACEYGPSPDNLMVAAINGPEYRASAACGTFIRATGPKGTVTVRIVDYCPECKEGDIDFSVEAFARIATAPPGRIPITWQIVPGDIEGPIRLRYREGSSRSWVAIQVRNHRLPITKLEVMPDGDSQWREAPRQSWNYFVVQGKVASGPIRVRVTALDGQTLEEVMPEPNGVYEMAGRGQF